MGYEIELNKEEAALLKDIQFDALQLSHQQYKKQGPLILQLLKLLKSRDAIPEVRLRYWSDPAYQVGPSKYSHKVIFERNGSSGEEIYTHPHFLEFLYYFLFGAQLPQMVIAEFKKMIDDLGSVTSSDINIITKRTRDIVRKYEQQGKEKEFYCLALDIGLSPMYAKEVRQTVKKVK